RAPEGAHPRAGRWHPDEDRQGDAPRRGPVAEPPARRRGHRPGQRPARPGPGHQRRGGRAAAAAGEHPRGRSGAPGAHGRRERGANRVAGTAGNDASSSQPVAVNLTYAAPADGKSRVRPSLYVLAVGISEYARSDLNLRFADRDAEDFAAAWKSQQGAVYEKVETRVITNKQASAPNIRDGMDWLVRSGTQHDLAILFLPAPRTYPT